MLGVYIYRFTHTTTKQRNIYLLRIMEAALTLLSNLIVKRQGMKIDWRFVGSSNDRWDFPGVQPISATTDVVSRCLKRYTNLACAYISRYKYNINSIHTIILKCKINYIATFLSYVKFLILFFVSKKGNKIRVDRSL